MAIIVSDTSPIRALSHLNLLHLLPTIFDEVLIPPAVAEELEHPRRQFATINVQSLRFMRVQAPADVQKVEELRRVLDLAEAEAIALALEVRVTSILIDEADGRRAAADAGLEPVGALGVLLRGKEIGEVNAVAPLLEQLERELKFRVSGSLRREVLRLAGEAP